MNTSKQDIVNLVEILAQLGLKAVVLSPGSRNAPLIKAFNQDSRITCYSIVDERSAGFVALGMAQQTQQPVAIVCTSGSALLNYGPAVVEAYYQRLPLLIISADRPLEWIGQADGQTIDQQEVFKNFSKAFINCQESKNDKTTQWYNERSIAEAYQIASSEPMGPVHLNIPLSEPLYQLGHTSPQLNKPVTVSYTNPLQPNPLALKRLIDSISKGKKVLFLIGQYPPSEVLTNYISKIAKLPQVSVLTETTANLFGQGYIDQIDRVLATINNDTKAKFEPEILVTLGGMVVSKRLKQFLRAVDLKAHWHIDSDTKHIDTYQQLSDHLHADTLLTLAQLSDNCQAAESSYREDFLQQKAIAKHKHETFSKTQAYSDFKVTELLLANLPDNSILQIGNSTPVRYVQLFENKLNIAHYCNRGVSGIDGCTSTAMGAAIASKKRVTLISGETSFLYDNNGLWNKYTPANFVAIVINNGGGNIFRIIDGPDQMEEMSDFIETAHQLSVKPLADLHHFRYFSAHSLSDVSSKLHEVFNARQKTIFEIFTPALVSPEVLRGYWKYLKEK